MNTINSIPDICELDVIIQPEPGGEALMCKVDLRLHSAEIPLSDEECEIGFKKISINVDLQGMKFKPSSRFGEPLKTDPISVTKKVQISNTKESNKGISTKLLSSPTKQDASLSLERKNNQLARNESEFTATTQEEYLRVCARPNGIWEVTEVNQEMLAGTYLETDVLFMVDPIQKANRQLIQMKTVVRQRDLFINQIVQSHGAVKFFTRLSTNQKRLFDIFVAKSLSSALYNGTQYLGEIVLSEFEIEPDKLDMP